MFLANLAVLAFSQMSGEHFLAWGWRIPFALSLILVGVGLYIRLGILETPVFAKLLAERKLERTPMLTVIKRHPKEILLSALARMAEQAPFYIFTAFVFSYGIGTLHVSRDFLLTAVLVGLRAVVCLDPVVRSSVRPHRPQEHVHDRRGHDRRVWLHLFRHAEHRIGADHLSRDHPFADSARHAVRPAGGTDRRKLYRRACATAAPRSAISSHPSSPAARRR